MFFRSGFNGAVVFLRARKVVEELEGWRDRVNEAGLDCAFGAVTGK